MGLAMDRGLPSNVGRLIENSDFLQKRENNKSGQVKKLGRFCHATAIDSFLMSIV